MSGYAPPNDLKPPAPYIHNGPGTGPSGGQSAAQDADEKKRRSYKACLHCRSRKARCDLGDVDCPREPPCSRCRREGRPCEFAPSRRGGNVKAKRKREREGSSLSPDEAGEPMDGYHNEAPRSGHGAQNTDSNGRQPYNQGQYPQAMPPPTSAYGLAPRPVGSDQIGSGYAHPAPLQPPMLRQTSSMQTWPSDQSATNYITRYPQYTPGQTQAQPAAYPSQPLISSGSPLRYSSLQNLLLPSPGGSSSYMSGESPAHPMSGETTRPEPLPLQGDVSSSNLSAGASDSRSPRDRDGQAKRHKAGSDRSQRFDGGRSTQHNIVKADMHNESDALAILALASREVEHEGKDSARQQQDDQRERDPSRRPTSSHGAGDQSHASGRTRDDPAKRLSAKSNPSELAKTSPVHGSVGRGGRHRSSIVSESGIVQELQDFDLVQRGIMTPADVVKLSDDFFRRHHHIFPMVPPSVVPKTAEETARFATTERYLVTAIIIIASRHDQSQKMRDIHDKSWEVMREYMNDVFYLGLQPTVGLVEGLLLLAENLPRNPDLAAKLERASGETKEGVHGAENRQAWMLTGMAIRTAYGLGLDQVATTIRGEGEVSLELERARLAWTYCFLFDRHISLRLGKAFWSRGPNLCFRGYSHLNQTGPAAARINFPTMMSEPIDSANGEDDGSDEMGCLVQAYVELTQREMSNAHDVLYPSVMRTHSLVKYGEYFKYMDDFNLSLETFQTVWRNKKWHTFPLTDIVWCMFNYVRLYISAFSFQAHVARASQRAEMEASRQATDGDHDPDQAWRPPESLFPRGGAASPDARYIYESIRAATEILEICVESLHPGGALPYLPSRFTLLYQYASVFLLKAVYSGAMVRSDTIKTLQLIDRVCLCLASSSQDKQHPAVRYAAMLRVLSKRLASASNPSAAASPPATAPPKDTPEPASGPADSSTQASIMDNARPEGTPATGDPGRRDSGMNWRPPPFPLQHSFAQPVYNSLAGPNGNSNGMDGTGNFVAAGGQIDGNGQQGAYSANSFMQGNGSLQTMDAARNSINSYEPPNMGVLQDYAATTAQLPSSMQQQQQRMHPGNGFAAQSGSSALPQDVNGLYSNLDHLFEPLAGAEENVTMFDFDLQDFWSKVGPGEAQGGFPFR